MEKEETKDGEVEIAVEKGSLEDQMLQALKHDGIEAEITGITIRGGVAGRYKLAEVEGVLVCQSVATAFTAEAIILPSGQVYLLTINTTFT